MRNADFVAGSTSHVNSLRSTTIDWNGAPDEVGNKPAPIWGPKEATAAFKRVVAKFGPKKVLGVIPPDAKVTHIGLEGSRGKTPGYKNPDGTWRGRNRSLIGPEADTTDDEIEKWGFDSAVVGTMTSDIHFFDNDGSDERVTRGINAIIEQETGAVLARHGANEYRCAYPFHGSGLHKIRLIYWQKGTPKPKKKAPALELLAVGNYINLYGTHKSGVLHTWRGGDFCDPDAKLPKLDIPTTDRVFAKVGAYLESEGYEWEITVGKGGARLHWSLCDETAPERVKEAAKQGAVVRRRGADLAPSLVHLADMLKACPNYFETEDEFFEAMTCIVGASGGDEAFYEQEVLPWALGWSDNTSEYVRKKWDYAKRRGTSLGYSRLCQITGYVAPDTFPDLTDDDTAAMDAAIENAPDDVSENALASRFADLHHENVRYAAKEAQWLEWNGNRWCPDEKLHLMTLARQFCRQIARGGKQ